MRRAGFILAVLCGLTMIAKPLPADDFQTHVDRAIAILNEIDKLIDSIIARNKAATASAEPTTMKCPVCKTMDMTTTPTASNTRAVKINGKTWYCCAGCDMSGVADKE
jgi:hypothetical protein